MTYGLTALGKSVHVLRSVEVCRTPVPNHCNVMPWGVGVIKLRLNGEAVTAIRLKEGTWEAVSCREVNVLEPFTFSGVM